jgi:glycerol-3-phosphate dehydrogenase
MPVLDFHFLKIELKKHNWRDYDISINVISKSGTTTEPALAFGILKEYMEGVYGREEASRRIYATTDESKGVLRALSVKEGYATFVVFGWGSKMNTNFDAIILGGGVNGCAIARKLSHDGKKVLLIERNTIGCGTSSNSSKLVHGGLRYLETQQFKLVKESLKDRKRLCELYPDQVQMAPFYLPVYEDSPRPGWMIHAGLVLFDLLSWSGGKQGDSPSGKGTYRCAGMSPWTQRQSPSLPRRDFRHRRVSKEEFLSRFPGVRCEGLRQVYMYYDGKTDDLELTRCLAGDAREAGCTILEGCRPEFIRLEAGGYSVGCRDEGGEQVYQAPVLINVTGPWINEVNETYNLPHDFSVSRVSGIHIVVDRLLVPDCMFLQTASRRIFFMIPWQERQTIIGTTERMENCSCDDVSVNEADIDYLIDCANHYLQEPLGREDVCHSFLGIRPLIRGKNESDATSMSREYKIEVIEREGAVLINVYGGKLTTCLSMAEKVAGVNENRGKIFSINPGGATTYNCGGHKY